VRFCEVLAAVLTEIKNRGVGDVCLVVCDGLKGLPEAIETVWPQAVTQTCVVHLLRASFRYASKRDWSALAKDLKPVYTAPSEQAALDAFAEFAGTWQQRYPAIIRLWQNAWSEFVPFLRFDTEIRAVVCTTDEIVKSDAGVWGGCPALLLRPAAAAWDRRPAAAVERPAGRTTLTAARTAVTSGCGGRG